MKFASNIFRTLLLALALFLITARVGAQSVGISANQSVNSIEVSNSLTYTIDVTNDSGADESIWITNTFSGALSLSLSDYSITPVSTGTNYVAFFLGTVLVNGIDEVTFQAQPLAIGTLTNTIVVVSQVLTNTLFTNSLVLSVINTNQADLGVTLSGFPTIAYSNDWVTYDLSVTNAGPANAPNVFVTNTIPTNEVELLAVSPTNQSPQTVNSNLIFNLGTLAVGAVTNLQFTVQPTNTGVFTFSASVGSTTETDPNTNNNSFSTNLTVTNFLAGTASLTASTSSAQVFNRQTGREQQVITLSNTGATPISAARVIVTGLTNWLFNAVGTNNGNPYVIYGTSLGAGQSINLTLQFYPNRSAFPFSNSQLVPVEIEQPDLSVPPVVSTSSAINILLASNLLSGYTLVEFQSISNRSYTIAYSDDMTNWLAAQPSFRTTANYVLWIDYGPPETLSNSPARYYRVYMNPQTP